MPGAIEVFMFAIVYQNCAQGPGARFYCYFTAHLTRTRAKCRCTRLTTDQLFSPVKPSLMVCRGSTLLDKSVKSMKGDSLEAGWVQVIHLHVSCSAW